MVERRHIVLCSGRYGRKYVYSVGMTKAEAEKSIRYHEHGATVRCRMKKMPCKDWDHKLRCY